MTDRLNTTFRNRGYYGGGGGESRLLQLKEAEIKLSKYCNLLRDRFDSASIQEKRYILDMLAIKVTATTDATNIEGIIPLKTIPPGFEIASVEPTHHCTNMGMFTLSCVCSNVLNYFWVKTCLLTDAEFVAV